MTEDSNFTNPNSIFADQPEQDQLLPYYVYELRDDAGGTFYVGKGQGNRAHHHTSEIKRQMDAELNSPKPEEKDSTEISQKQAKIKAILDAGETPTVVIIGRFETEDEALAVEAALINWVYGHPNLLNISRGRRASKIRPRGNLGELPDIDIARVRNLRTGEYTAGSIARLQRANAYDFLTEIRSVTERSGFSTRGFENQIDRPFHPGESNGYLAFLVRLCELDFLVSFSHTLRPSISIANTESTRQHLGDAMTALCRHFDVSEPKNLRVNGEGRYIILCRNGRPLRFECVKDTVNELTNLRKILSGTRR